MKPTTRSIDDGDRDAGGMEIGIKQNLCAEDVIADAVAGHGLVPDIKQFLFVASLVRSNLHLLILSFQSSERDALDEIALQEDEYKEHGYHSNGGTRHEQIGVVGIKALHRIYA